MPSATRVRQDARFEVHLSGRRQKTYKLSDQQTPEKFAAQKVKVTGTLFEKTGVLKVDKIEAVR